MFLLERFDRPWCLWLALVVVFMWWLSRRSLAGLGPLRSRVCMLTRAVVVALLVLAMAGTHKILKNDDLNVLFLLDQSRSIPTNLRRGAESFIRRIAGDIPQRDRLGMLTFDGQTTIEQLPSRRGPGGALHVPTPFADGSRPDRTNLAQGLRMAAACAQDSANNRVVILSDGNQNVGDVIEEVKTARANNITVDVIPLRYERGAEVVFEQLRAPAYANLNEQVSLRLILSSDRRTTGTVYIYQRIGQDEEPLDLSPNTDGYGQRVTLRPGRNAFTVRTLIQTARAHQFRAEFVPDDEAADAVVHNNVARAFTNVEGPRTVLFVGNERDREGDKLLIDALRAEDIRVRWETPQSVSLDTSVLQDYAAIVLANVGSDNFRADEEQALVTYVRDLGGGLVMIGGDDSFGAGGWQGSVVEDIMPVRCEVDALRQIPRGALAIVMHSCEMPQGNKWGIEVAVAALKTISRLDYFGVVGWTNVGTGWEVRMQPARNKDAITRQIRKMQNGDMPDFQSSMQLAYQGLLKCKDAAQRHMIIISDGDASPPTAGLLNKLRGHKITCSTVSVFPHGFGMGTMKHIAKVTGGRHYSLYKPGDEKRLPKIFVKEAKIVRRPLIRDELFMPVRGPDFFLSDIMAGIDENLPALRGYVVTTPRKVADVEMALVTKKGDPLLAHWLCGFGRTVAFTSGRWNQWGAEWPGWPGFSKLWAQTLRWVMQQGTAADYDITTVVEGDEAHVVIESADDQEGFTDFRQFIGRVVQPDGTAADLSIVQTGPGRYEGRFKVGGTGTYPIIIRAVGGQEDSATVIRTGVTVSYSPEFKDLEANEPLLREVAEKAGGRVFSFDVESEQVFAHNLPPTLSRKPVWDTLLKLAAMLFLLDVAFRRIAIDPVKVAVAARSTLASLAGRFGAGRRAEATLTDLKTVRDRVRAERTSEGDAGAILAARDQAKADADQAAVSVDAAAKFDAGDAAAKPAGDLVETLGGHKREPDKPKPSDAEKDGDQPKESTTAKLLRAKRKAKRDKDQQEQ